MDKTLKIAILLTAVDHMSEKVTQAVEKSQRKLKMISGLNSFGSMAITGGTAALEFLEKTVEAAEESEVATNRLAQVYSHSIKNYKAAAEASQDYASKLQMQIGLEDEVILGVQAKLGIFKRVTTEASMANGVFNRATRAAFDMQAAGFGDASMNIVKLGKTLDNPIKSINSLSKVGIIFNKTEQETIRKLIQSGKLFQAQDMILKKVESRVGGVAAKTAPATAKMKVAWSEVSESIGKHLLPHINRLANFLSSSVIPKISAFIEKHPQLVKWIGIAAAALLALGIAAKVVAAAMVVLQVASGPVGWIIMGIAALAFVLIKYWKPISAFFVRLWNGIKNFFLAAWQWIKKLLWDYQPAVLIFKNWSKIKQFFSALWTGIKNIFSNTWNWIKNMFLNYTPYGLIIKHWTKIIAFFKGLGKTFYDAGKNIINSIWNGMNSIIAKPYNAVKGMVKKIRNLLPFSPAKDGPLKDLHKIKLVETIAASINSKPLIKAMSGALGDMSGYNRAIPSPVASTVGGGSVVINYNPTINGGAAGIDLRKHAKEIAAMVNEEMRKRERTKF